MDDTATSKVVNRQQAKFNSWRYVVLLGILLLATIMLLGPTSRVVRAATFTVNTTTDAVDNNLADNECNIGDGTCSLRAAIQQANDLSGADTIEIEPGIYTLSLAGSDEDANATGDLDITDDVTINGAGLGSTIIDGGALDRVFHIVSGTASISNLAITNGQTFLFGGGVSIESGAVLDMQLSAVNSNQATGGGGLHNLGTATIDQTTFSNNNGIEGAGGILNDGALTLTRSAITGNTNSGVENGATADLTNVTISGNGSSAITTFGGSLSVAHSTITLNSASGLDAFGGGSISLSHTIVADNEDDCTDGTITSLGYNLFKSGVDDQCNALAVAVGDQTGVDPLLAALADNGGTTLTHAITIASAAYDAGDPEFAPPPATDQRGAGYPRVSNGTIDIGAFELGAVDIGQLPPNLIVNTVDDPGDGVCTTLHCSLREAIDTANANANLGSLDSISFNIAGAGPHIIQPASALPAITEAVIIDGSTDPDGIVLDGSLAGADVPGITFASDSSELSYLEIRNFDGPGVLVSSGQGNSIRYNSIHDNGGLGIDLGDPESGIADGVTPNDYLDADTGPNQLLNRPVLQRVVNAGGDTIVQGFLNGPAETSVNIDLYSTPACDASYYGEGTAYLTTENVIVDPTGYVSFEFTLPAPLPDGTGVAATTNRSNIFGTSTSEFSRCMIAGANNDSWPNALEIPLEPVVDGRGGGTTGYITQPSQSRWYRFPVGPNNTVIVDLTDLPANYDLTLYTDIAKKYSELTAPADLDDLVELNAEFAPDMYSPDMYSPDMYSPDMYSPDMYSPDMYSPDMYSPDMYSPDMYSPDMYSPDMYSPDMYSPDMYSPDMYSPDMYSPDMYSPDMYSSEFYPPGAANPDQRYFVSAQTQSTIAVSGFEGTSDETVVGSSWSEYGDFYVRVRGRNGVFNPTSPFTLGVTVLGNECLDLTKFDFAPDTTGITAGAVQNLILVDYDRMAGPQYGSLVAMQAAIGNLATAVNGVVVDLGQFPEVVNANAQADGLPKCVFAKNLVAYAIKDIVDAYRQTNPIENVVIVGSDNIIPFFRYPDQGLLANEDNYEPPVQDLTASQASLRLGYILSQDTYGAAVEISRQNSSFPIPLIPVGRLVERPWEIENLITTFLDGGGVVSNPAGALNALVTGYDFLDDGATAVAGELRSGLDTDSSDTVDPVATLISAATVAPAEAWTAGDLKGVLLDSGRHDLIYLAGHFSAGSTLAADYETRLLASEVAASSVDMSNIIVFSAGCHSGYNLVNEHAVPYVSFDPDWAQAFAQKGALLIAGTGYQYGDTDFVEYSERLYREFATALREGTGPVSAGEALVRAKQVYLADTAEMRDIHVKVLLQSTIFGLPMLSIDMPAGRGTLPGEPSIVTPPLTGYGADPGLTLGLQYADVTVTPPVTRMTKSLDSVQDGSGVMTTYYQGEDGLVINPGEPIRPLDQFNVSVPGTVLRGIGFRGGSYTDDLDVIPLTGAATTELRGIHTPFITPVFFPVVPWQANYFDALANSASGGQTRLAVIPAQYRSNSSDSVDGTVRVFDNMAFRLFYNANTTSYPTAEPGVINIPALASPPVINSVLAQENGGNVDFSVQVTGDPSAGIQEAWVTYTALSGPFAGQWYSFDLTQDSDQSTLWAGSLPLSGTPAADMRFMVQAVNGVGLVSLATNRGTYYTPGIDPGDPPTPPGDLTPAPAVPTTLTLSAANPGSGTYGKAITVSAELLDDEANPLVGKTVEFGLTTQRISVQTNGSGVATANLTIVGEPVNDILRVSFDGDSTYAAASDSAPFAISPIATYLVLQTDTPTFNAGGSADITISLTDDTGRPLREKAVLIVADDGTNFFGEVAITNLYGNAVVRSLNWPVADSPFTVNAYFASMQTVNGVEVDMTNSRYLPSSTSLLLIENTPPVADAGGPYAVGEGETVALNGGGSSDVDGGQLLTYRWDLDDNGSYETVGVNPNFNAGLRDGPGSATVNMQVCDPVGDCDVANDIAVAINNVAPSAVLQTDVQGSDFTLSLGSAADPSSADTAAGFEYAFDCGAGYGPWGASSSAVCSPGTGGTLNVGGKIRDKDGGVREYRTDVTVDCAGLCITGVRVPPEPVDIQNQAAYEVVVTFTDTTAPYTCSIDLDGAGAMPAVAGTVSGNECRAALNYSEVGVYRVTAMVEDAHGAVDTAAADMYLVIYDPSGGFVTGGGWIYSPPGAYTGDPDLEGRADFAFVSKYNRGKQGPTGKTEFNFEVAGFSFYADDYDWLVVAGAKAMYKGSGTVNDSGNYGFLLSAIDAKLTPSTDVDLFRIKIWDKDNGDQVIYDNLLDPGASDNADPTTAIGGGSIVIHDGKKKR